MIDKIWLFLIMTGILVAFFNGNIGSITSITLTSIEDALKLTFNLLVIMSLWMGVMKIAQKAGLVQRLAGMIRPFIRGLFPEVKEGNPAATAISLNIIANMLGLGNAATPLGIKAVKELQKINPHKDTATNAMCMLLVINTSSVQLIPATIIAIRASAGSANPGEIIGTVLVATIFSTIIGIFCVKMFQKMC